MSVKKNLEIALKILEGTKKWKQCCTIPRITRSKIFGKTARVGLDMRNGF